MRVFLFIGLLLLSGLRLAHAATAESHLIVDALHRADTLKLAEHPAWLKLLHAETSGINGLKSAIHSTDFFIHPKGATDFDEELKETIYGIFKPAQGDINNHIQCRFPARYQWLKRTLFTPLQKGMLTDIVCPAYTEWLEQTRADSVSVIYATGFLGNPASYYGHTLLKFNQPESLKSSNSQQLLNTAVNFGALVPENENPVLYVLRGIAGFYEAGFSQARYYHHNQSYGELELRDLWEYELSLPPEAVSFILAHIWEIQRKKYTYYFFTHNCAYRLGELLEIVEGVSVNPSPYPWVIPQTQIQLIGSSVYAGQPLLRQATFHASRQTRLYQRFSSLTPLQKTLVTTALDDIDSLNTGTFRNMPLTGQHLILDTLLDYFRFLEITQKERAERIRPIQQKVLALRYQLPPGLSVMKKSTPLSPHLGRPPSWVQLKAFHNNKRGNGQALTFRPAYYDALDAGPGHKLGAQLAMGKLSVEYQDKSFYLRELEIARISNANTQATGLPGDNNNAWQLALTWTSLSQFCTDCRVFRLETDRGKTWKITENIAFSGSLGAALQSRKHQTSPFFGYGKIQALYTGQQYSLQGTFRQNWHPKHRKKDVRTTHSLTLRKPITPNWDLRFGYLADEATELSLGIGYYW
ncbi:DUF4105 domain-containing protein [Parendozoicomonas sp. Alg238-R29]|uniref:Lnb N-terminal periplasmic domain-containing protein n=1 Tax=Parendozoicomonas sp. Alg238-R29 TaxID=2993446 RepID=UPI00248E5288|nr:DUF4105 domain-containing protein [Parendozoicomonas sp. Alg238-R29]